MAGRHPGDRSGGDDLGKEDPAGFPGGLFEIAGGLGELDGSGCERQTEFGSETGDELAVLFGFVAAQAVVEMKNVKAEAAARGEFAEDVEQTD
jgi:hypothetical protein